MKETKNINKHTTDMLRDILSGRLFSNIILIKYRWYVLFLFSLALAYMSMHYYMEKTVQEIAKEERELIKLREAYTTRLWDLESLNKRSAIVKQVESRNIDIKEPKKPAKKIKMN